jgi:hypothetical protein
MDEELITVTVPAPDGKGVVEYQVYVPTPEQLLLFASAMTGEQAKLPAAIVEMLQDVLEPEQFEEIRSRLRARRNDPARLTLQNLMDLLEQLMEGAADFPMEPSSASPEPPALTGRRSTGRVRSQASTPSASRAVAS